MMAEVQGNDFKIAFWIWHSAGYESFLEQFQGE